jgi:hypothetical protein
MVCEKYKAEKETKQALQVKIIVECYHHIGSKNNNV